MYGLPEQGGTCPGATAGPGGCLSVPSGWIRQTCYMANICKIYKGVKPRLEENTRMLQGKTEEELVAILTDTVKEFLRKKGSKEPYFRLHYSGDFFSEVYAKAWVKVFALFPQVRFWTYTRSFTKELNVIPILAEATNLTLYLSADPVNYTEAVAVLEQFQANPRVAICWLGGDPPKDRRWVACPETSGILKNTDAQGACSKCRLCVDRIGTKARNIRFLLH